MTLQEHLRSLGACDGALVWSVHMDASEAWRKCRRPDWLIWWAARTNANDPVVILRVLAACVDDAMNKKGNHISPKVVSSIAVIEGWLDDPFAMGMPALAVACRTVRAEADSPHHPPVSAPGRRAGAVRRRGHVLLYQRRARRVVPQHRRLHRQGLRRGFRTRTVRVGRRHPV